MRKALVWLVLVLALGAMVVLVAGSGWLVYHQVTGGLEPAKRPTALPSPLVRPVLPVSAKEDLVHRLVGLYVRLRSGDLNQPAGDGPEVTFQVQLGETVEGVASRLAQEGLVRDPELFRLYMRYGGLDRGLEAGGHALSPSMTVVQIAERLQRAQASEVMVTIPEGWRMEQVATLLDQQSVLPGQQFLNLVREERSDYAFLGDRPAGATLEGYLFPDTYRLPVDAHAADLVDRMLRNFDSQVTPQMRQDAAARGWSLFQVIVLASIVEREGVLRSELPLIASVYCNRLAQDMKLDADPTVQYALGFQSDTGKWWKSPLRLEEYAQVDSAYNTYLHPGLPPGPICNPGLAAISAVIYPAPSDYLYFVRNDVADDGSHIFARTFEEHQGNMRLYQK